MAYYTQTYLPSPGVQVQSLPLREEFSRISSAFVAAEVDINLRANVTQSNTFSQPQHFAGGFSVGNGVALNLSVASSLLVPAPSQSNSAVRRADLEATITQANGAGMPLWSSNTSYVSGAPVISPLSLLPYRRRTAGASTTDPSLDPINWDLVAAAAPPIISVAAASVNAAVNGHYILVANSQQTVVLPSPVAPGDIVIVTIANDRVDNVLAGNGNLIMNINEDMVITSMFITIIVRFFGAAAGGWRLV